jgi:hypothetical protein
MDRTTGKSLRVAILILACSLLSSCYLVPASFDAHLHVAKDGSFTYRYLGKIAFALPEQPAQDWRDEDARCQDEKGNVVTCSADKIAEQRAEYEAQQRQSAEAAAEIEELIGFNPFDKAANERIAAEMVKVKGWNRVLYRGQGVFDVDYKISGTLDRDFIFPVLPQAQLVMPFVAIKRSRSGTVEISAPGLVGGRAQNIVAGQVPAKDIYEIAFFERINGTFRLTTDAELSAHNGKRVGKQPDQAIEWRIEAGRYGGDQRLVPAAQIVLPETK